jgi:type I restriction enzyme S subunit
VSQDWRDVTLGELFEITSSKRVLQRQWETDGVPFYRAREIVALSKNGTVDNDVFISEELFEECKDKYGTPRPGDLMVSAVGTLGACYVVQPHDRFYFKDASVLRFSPKEPVDSRFIQHAFRTRHIQDQIHSGSGSTVGTYTITRAKKTRISLPPHPEQKRIAAILDAADELRTKRRDSCSGTRS